jgi:hypothetical protein
MTRIQPWTEPALMQREQVFEGLTTKAIKQTVRAVVSQLREGVLTAAPVQAPAVNYAAAEAAVMATWEGYVSAELYPFLTNTFLTSATAVVEGVAAASGEVVDHLTNTYAQEFLAYAENRMVGIGEQLWLAIRSELEAGFEAGEGIKEIAARLSQVAGLATPRALTVARTEIISAANAGSYLQMLNAGFEEKVTKVWLATEDTRTRESHRHADNQGVLLTDEFSVDIYSGDVKTGTEGLEFPGDPTGTPGNIINCFPGDTTVQSVGSAELLFRRWYEGPVVVVNTASGVQLTGTPNHPVLTDFGWKPLKFVNSGDKLVKAVFSDVFSELAPQKNYVPTEFSQMYDLATDADGAQRARRVAGIPFDFHGDGVNGEIDVVTLNRGLPLPGGESVCDDLLILDGSGQESLSGTHGFGMGDVVADVHGSGDLSRGTITKSFVGSGSQTATLVLARSGHALEHGSTAVARLDTSLEQTSAYSTAADAELLGKTLFGDSFRVKLDQVVSVHMDTIAAHVYNLQTESGTYIANGIVAHNCRCSLAFDFEDEDEDGDVLSAAGFVEKQHPRDNEGKFKKKGVPDASAPKIDKIKYIIANKLPTLPQGQKKVFLDNIDQEDWDQLTAGEQLKVQDAVLNTSHPEAKLVMEKKLSKLIEGEGPQAAAPVDAVKRPLGGVDAKTGKPLVPGKPTKLRVQLLYNTKFENGAIMAVHKDSGERIVWDEDSKKIKRQKLVDGKYQTTEALTRGNAYAKWKDEEGWSIPDAATLPQATEAGVPTPASAPALSVGKPVALKVQLIYQTPFNDGDTVAVKPSTGEKITWNAGKKRMVVHAADGTTTEYTRGALYKAYKDDTGWFLPGDGEPDDIVDSDAPTPDITPADIVSPEPSQDVLPGEEAAPFQTVEKIGSGAEWQAALDSMAAALNDPSVPEGTVLFSMSGMSITKKDDGVATLKTAKGEKIIYDGDLTPDGFIANVLSIGTPAAAPPPPTFIPVKKKITGNNVIDSDIAYVDDNFSKALVGDVLLETDAVTIEKANEDQVSINMKDDLGNFTTKDIEDLTADHVNDFIELNTPEAAPVPTGVSAEAQSIFNAYANEDMGLLWLNNDIKVTKTGTDKVIVEYTGGSEPFIGILNPANVTPENLDKAIKAVKAGLDFNSTQPIPDIPVSPATPPVPSVQNAVGNVEITNKPLTPSVGPTKPLKMSYGLLVNPKTTGQYTDGQLLAFHPETEADAGDELLTWNAKTKKFDVYTRTTNPPGDWQKIFSYNKQTAYKNLKDDDGWTTVPAGIQNPAGTAVPAVQGGSDAPAVAIPEPTTGLKPKFTTVELKAAADSKVAKLTDAQVKKIYGDFRQKPSGNAYDVVRLNSPGEDVLEGVLRAQMAFNKANPNEPFNMLETIRAVDIQAAKDANVANSNLFEKKLVAWLESPDGKKKAPQVLHEFRLSPAEKAKIEADKKAVEKAKLDAQLKDFHAITAGLSKPSTTSQDFKPQTVTSAQEAQDKMLAGASWTAKQKAALKKYTGSYYHTLNGMLRGLSKPTPETIADAVEVQKGMRPLAHDMLLYRGTGALPGILPGNIAEYANLIGGIYQEPAFSSTSINNPFGGKVKLEIEAPAGTPAAYVKSISHFSSENEVLLAAGTKFQILSAKEQGYSIVVRVRVVP